MRDTNSPPRVQAWHFNINPFRPKQCQGGPVYFGWWAKVAGWTLDHIDKHGDEQTRYGEWEMSAEQVDIKRRDGLIQ